MNTPPKDKGARFRKCDFQVHSMRDLQWSGPFNPVSDRAAFAAALVAECRRKGLDAIAITDHHDLCLWETVNAAAEAEKDAQGQAYDSDSQLTVFPGVELTLSTPPCQAILLLDPSLPVGLFSTILGTLQIAQNASHLPKTILTQPLHHDLTLEEITSRLNQIRTNPAETNPNKFQFLKKRFILLPNVKKGGHQTIVRDNFHTHFAAMPCVGGYIEGCLYSELEDGNRAKIEGKIEQWGKKALGVFQTSDCRKAEIAETAAKEVIFPELGNWPTWVKWAQPSAEALRQACLARRSRISHIDPAFPLFQIVGVTVSDSRFLGTVELGLNSQFNAFIGGRGTGKSSLLEYIRWALCDDPLPVQDTSELPDFQKRRRLLINDTLKPHQASVVVFYKKNGVVYRVERSLNEKSESIVVYNPDGTSQPYSTEQVRREFPIVSYAQKQLSSVGTLPEEINRLITDPVKNQLAQLQETIEGQILPDLRLQRTREVRLKRLALQLHQSSIAIKSKKEQVTALQSQLQTLTPEQQALINSHESISREQQVLNRAEELPTKVSELLDHCRKQLKAIGSILIDRNLPNAAEVEKISKDAAKFLKDAEATLEGLSKKGRSRDWLETGNELVVEKLRKVHLDHQAQYNVCVEANSKNTKQLEEIRSLNQQITELEQKHSSIEAEKASLEVAFQEVGDSAWQAFVEALEERAKLLRDQCSTVAAQAQDEFKPELRFCGKGESVAVAIETLVQGRNVKDSEDKADRLTQLVTTSDHPVLKWREVMGELDALIEGKEETTIPETPILKEAGFTLANLDSIRNGVREETLDQVRYLNIEDQIVFSFRLGKKGGAQGNYIAFDLASPGQQATCLLRTLLAQEGAPLLIDQPEEDLDNEQIHILAERIAETKHNRQLIFVSHNANIVVNGDAELVVCFGYADPNDNAHGKIDPVGSIDCEPVRNAIASVMEGGRQAFELRQNKYGF